jgi:hypothetical protein
LDNRKYLKSILNNRKLDICIDDGVHSDETVLKTFHSFLPFLKDHFVYFIEDNAVVHKKISERYPSLRVNNFGRLTVIREEVVR